MADTTINCDLPCQRCGYNVRGLSSDSACPECNAPIIAAVYADRMECADPVWLGKLTSGVNNLLLAGLVILIATPVLQVLEWLSIPEIVLWLMGFASASAFSAFACVGAWQLGTPNQRVAADENHLSHRRIFRSIVPSSAITVLSVIPLYFSYVPGALAIVLSLGAPIGLLGAISAWSYGQYMQDLATRVGDDVASRNTRVYKIGYVCSSLLLITGNLGLVLTNSDGWALILLPGIVGVFGFGLFLMFAVPDYVGNAFEESCDAATKNWAIWSATGMIGRRTAVNDEPSDAMTLVYRVAAALDRDDFVMASGFVHPECVYESPGGRMVGRDAIIDSYRKNAEWARAAFDRIEYESSVEPMADGRFRVTYTDRTWHTPRTTAPEPLAHVYQCQQILTVNEDGLITHIEHVEIPGQRQALEAYLTKCGVKRS